MYAILCTHLVYVVCTCRVHSAPIVYGAASAPEEEQKSIIWCWDFVMIAICINALKLVLGFFYAKEEEKTQ